MTVKRQRTIIEISKGDRPPFHSCAVASLPLLSQEITSIMIAPSIFFGTSWEDEVAQAPVTPESKQHRKSFQYAGHFQPGHDYSPFHKQLDASLKHLYSKTNLAAVVLEKGWLTESELHRLDNAIMDIWALVVWVKIPAQIPYKKTICRFISKKDFLRVVIESAQPRSEGMTACKHEDISKVLIESTSGKYYELTPQYKQCECSCPAYESLSAAFGEDTRMEGLLKADPILKGQVLCKHIYGLWSAWGIKNFKAYQGKQQDWERQQQATQQYKDTLRVYRIALKQSIPGHLDVLTGPKILGSVDRRYDSQNNSWWINQRQISRNSSVPGDHIHYGTAEEAAIALAKLCKVIDEGEQAKSDLFGGGWDEQPEHLIEPHSDFIDDIDQEARSQPVAVASRKKALRDPFGGFDF